MVQVRPEGPKAHSPGRAADRSSVLTPLSSKAFVLTPLSFKAFVLTPLTPHKRQLP